MVIDVKVGPALLCATKHARETLAHALVETGNSCGIRTRALLTDMNRAAGSRGGKFDRGQGMSSSCCAVRSAEGARPVLEFSLELSAHMLVLAHVD